MPTLTPTGLPQNPERSTPASAAAERASFALYTRAADRVEVATAVALGRTIDRTG
jgi:hypothetical protein